MTDELHTARKGDAAESIEMTPRQIIEAILEAHVDCDWYLTPACRACSKVGQVPWPCDVTKAATIALSFAPLSKEPV